MNLKKILLISNPCFSKNGSNGKTFLSLFSDFEDKNVCQLYFNDEYPIQNKFSNFFRITNLDILKYFLSLGFCESFGQLSINQLTSDKQMPTYVNTPNIGYFFKKIYRDTLFNCLILIFPNKLKGWLESNNITKIFFVGSPYLYSYFFLKKISDLCQVKYCIYFTDDYFLYNNGDNFVDRFFHKLFVKFTKPVVKNAEKVFVISPKMKEEYDDFFEIDTDILINATINPSIDVNYDADPIVFSYFGWLHSDRIDSIFYLNECLDFVAKKINLNYLIEIYTLSDINEIAKLNFNQEKIKIFSPVFGNDYLNAMQKAKFLIHAESFSEESKKITKLSISTKITEYLNSNRCIIAIGPSDIASIELILNHKLGLVLNEMNIEKDSLKLKELLENKFLYDSYIENAKQYLFKHLNPNHLKSNLKKILFS